MIELKLTTGPALLSRRWVYDPDTEIGAWVNHDVTARAHEFLFESVELDEGLSLGEAQKWRRLSSHSSQAPLRGTAVLNPA